MKVSILSAVHNEALYIEEMIDSVLDQTVSDWELLFVSDGSTDTTVDQVMSRAAQDGRIRLIGDGSKIGKVAAFNQAYAASSGEVIVLLAGDDTLPPDSLEIRARPFAGRDNRTARMVCFCKLVTMSDDPRHDGMLLPRGEATSHSGGTITMSRGLADLAFPVDPGLVSEDPWLSRAAEGIADEVVEVGHPVLNYRIHEANSNPRMQSFAVMSEAMARRHEAWRLLLDCERLPLSEQTRTKLVALYRAELLRRQGQVPALIGVRDLPLVDRVAFAAMAHPLLFRVRQRFYRLFTGRRGR